VAAKPIDTDLEMLNELAAHAEKLLADFIDLPPSARPRQSELIAEFEEVVRHSRRLRPPPTFKRKPYLRVAANPGSLLCSICQRPVDLTWDNSFQTAGAAYHRSCYSKALKTQLQKKE
jgi:hypothetical protein